MSQESEILTIQPPVSNTWELAINNSLFNLTITRIRGECCQCPQSGIRLIWQKPQSIAGTISYQERKYCQSCTEQIFLRLESDNYQLAKKKQVIAELRRELERPLPRLWADYFTGKKPHCWTCWGQDLSADIYQFCGADCALKDWIKFHGQASAVPSQ